MGLDSFDSHEVVFQTHPYRWYGICGHLKNMQISQRAPGLNLWPSCCEATLLTTAPPNRLHSRCNGCKKKNVDIRSFLALWIHSYSSNGLLVCQCPAETTGMRLAYYLFVHYSPCYWPRQDRTGRLHASCCQSSASISSCCCVLRVHSFWWLSYRSIHTGEKRLQVSMRTKSQWAHIINSEMHLTDSGSQMKSQIRMESEVSKWLQLKYWKYWDVRSECINVPPSS